MGYDTKVGERGLKISGGQVQRIAIARALYNNAEILFLDEATSALDQETEKRILDRIESLSNEITTIQITHRLSTLSNCDHIFKLEKGKIEKLDKLNFNKKL